MYRFFEQEAEANVQQKQNNGENIIKMIKSLPNQ